MRTRKIIVICIVVFLFFVAYEILFDDFQKNNKNIKQEISFDNAKYGGLKVRSQKRALSEANGLKVFEYREDNKENKEELENINEEKSNKEGDSEEKEKTVENSLNNESSLNDIYNKEIKNNEKIKYYKVVRIVDGDTIVVNIEGVNETIRLIGINTPETKDPRKLVECFGVEASKKAKELLENKLVFLETDATQAERDKYNRLLRYAKMEDGLFYNLEIIKQGYAYEYTYIIPYKYQSEFKEAENYARTNKLGLWADGACKN